MILNKTSDGTEIHFPIGWRLRICRWFVTESRIKHHNLACEDYFRRIKHRLDRYLENRKSIAPSCSVQNGVSRFVLRSVIKVSALEAE